jgi:hypothetical protein
MLTKACFQAAFRKIASSCGLTLRQRLPKRQGQQHRYSQSAAVHAAVNRHRSAMTLGDGSHNGEP